MQKPFGYSLNLRLSPARPLFSLGPGWAALAGVLAGGGFEWRAAALLPLLALWLLVDPLLGSLWDVVVTQQLWRQLTRAELPPSPRRGFVLPYAQPGSAAGRFSVWLRRYRLWWQNSYWPQSGGSVLTALLSGGLALLLGTLLDSSIFWLVVLALAFTLLAGVIQPGLETAGGGRLASVVQFLLPWGMGTLLFPNASRLALILGICYWCVYLGGLRQLGRHRRASWLFILGQAAAIGVLLALRLLPGAAIAGVLLAAQLLLRTGSPTPAQMLARVQPYLVLSLLAAAVSLGGWGG